MASQNKEDCRLAVTQVLKLRAGVEYGDTRVRPQVTPKLNMSASSRQTMISWQLGQLHESVSTSSLRLDQIQEIQHKPFEVPNFSSHTQSGW